jgi:hypothetical protein
MASNAATTTPGRTARVIHWLFPSRKQVAVSLAADVGLAVLGLPLWMHLALGVALHLTFHLVARRR